MRQTEEDQSTLLNKGPHFGFSLAERVDTQSLCIIYTYRLFFFQIFFQDFFTFRQLILDMGVFIRFMGSPDCNFMKIAMGEVYFRGT